MSYARTSYGTWANTIDALSPSVEYTLVMLIELADDEHDPRVIAAAEEYRAAVNKALPDCIVLRGNEFFGPYTPDDAERAEMSAHPRTETGDLDLYAVIADVDVWAIVERHVPDRVSSGLTNIT
jgi:hypothetical protein